MSYIGFVFVMKWLRKICHKKRCILINFKHFKTSVVVSRTMPDHTGPSRTRHGSDPGSTKIQSGTVWDVGVTVVLAVLHRAVKELLKSIRTGSKGQSYSWLQWSLNWHWTNAKQSTIFSEETMCPSTQNHSMAGGTFSRVECNGSLSCLTNWLGQHYIRIIL